MERERAIIQYIGYCADEVKRTSKKLYSAYDVEYPLVEAGITTQQALEICKDYGFDFGGVYEHHIHFNCWLCPLQRVNELESIFKEYPDKWDYLRNLQHQTDGYYQNGKTIFEYEKKFWDNKQEELKNNRMNARERYNKRRRL